MKYFNQFGNITISLIRAHRLILVCLLLLIPIKVWAYRPFASTDADVVAANELEIELGYFNWERTSGENSYVTPQLVFNYGLTNTLELIAEFDLEHDLDGKSQPVDPGLFLKKVFKAGVLQDSEGVSFALEGGLLLPSAVAGENSTGFEAIGILSGSLSSFTWHLNLGGGVDRVDRNNFGVWGVILEHPVTPNLRLVAELNGEKLKNEAADNSGLLGAIWEPSSLPGLAIDIGIRRGTTDAASDWGATLGLSFSF
ncbi:MAG: hypothetical protein VYA05_06535 [Pseudomonadota bacterium]|nr:hypothetical protein [Pseudomonadota bacterium]